MTSIDVKKMKLPLTKKRFKKLRNAIRTKKVKWLDMSTDLMYAYQDYWRYHRHTSEIDTIDE